MRIAHNRVPQVMAAVAKGTQELEESTKLAILERAKELAPVETGFLQGSIEEAEGGVISGAPYSGFVNFGWTYAAANPYFSNAIGSAVPGFNIKTKALLGGF